MVCYHCKIRPLRMAPSSKSNMPNMANVFLSVGIPFMSIKSLAHLNYPPVKADVNIYWVCKPNNKLTSLFTLYI